MICTCDSENSEPGLLRRQPRAGAILSVPRISPYAEATPEIQVLSDPCSYGTDKLQNACAGLSTRGGHLVMLPGDTCGRPRFVHHHKGSRLGVLVVLLDRNVLVHGKALASKGPLDAKLLRLALEIGTSGSG